MPTIPHCANEPTVNFQPFNRCDLSDWHLYILRFMDFQVLHIFNELPPRVQIYILMKHTEMSLYISLHDSISTFFTYDHMKVIQIKKVPFGHTDRYVLRVIYEWGRVVCGDAECRNPIMASPIISLSSHT